MTTVSVSSAKMRIAGLNEQIDKKTEHYAQVECDKNGNPKVVRVVTLTQWALYMLVTSNECFDAWVLLNCLVNLPEDVILAIYGFWDVLRPTVGMRMMSDNEFKPMFDVTFNGELIDLTNPASLLGFSQELLDLLPSNDHPP